MRRRVVGACFTKVSASFHERFAALRRSCVRIGVDVSPAFHPAARGPEGRTFAWGNTPPDRCAGCWGGRPILGKQGPCPVGFFEATNTPSGLADMTGNLWEWTSNGYAFV
jgi:hypothetical protein